jgi:hypothetical protein
MHLLKDFKNIFIRWVFLTMPMYHLTVAGVPPVIRVPQFEKPWIRKFMTRSIVNVVVLTRRKWVHMFCRFKSGCEISDSYGGEYEV